MIWIWFGFAVVLAIAALALGCVAVNLRSQKRLHASLELVRRELEHVDRSLTLAGAPDGRWEWDLKRNQVRPSAGMQTLLGLPRQLASAEFFAKIESDSSLDLKTELDAFLSGHRETFEEEIAFRDQQGKRRWMLCRAARSGGRDDPKLVARLNDVSEIRAARREIERSTVRDKLTGLPNRRAFEERLAQAIERRRRDPDFRFAILFFDFDRFKVVNDSLGHRAGDALLASIGERFRETVRDLDYCARFGGDEFVVLLDGISSSEEGLEIGERLLETFEAPHLLSGHQIVTTASIGIVGSEREDDRPEDILRDAAIAMQAAKREGKARYCVFDEEMRIEAIARLQLEEELRSASLDEHFRLYYQPIVHIESSEVRGFEALVRWEHPKRGVITPDDFIRIAEETGLIIPLGEWILRQGCRQLKTWTEQFGAERKISVNVNLSRRQLVSSELVDQIRCAIQESEVDPTSLKLEITESTILDESRDLRPMLEELRATGAVLAMDDFGTGHSSLSCLHRFPFDVLKIDRSFIVSLEERRELTAVLHSIVSLAKDLNLEVVAEGIENTDQLAQLQAMDCDYAQGYLFARALTADEATELLKNPVMRSSASPTPQGS